jgi:hypothetical protein
LRSCAVVLSIGSDRVGLGRLYRCRRRTEGLSVVVPSVVGSYVMLWLQRCSVAWLRPWCVVAFVAFVAFVGVVSPCLMRACVHASCAVLWCVRRSSFVVRRSSFVVRPSVRSSVRRSFVVRATCYVLRATCCVLRAACYVLRAACCVLRAATTCYVVHLGRGECRGGRSSGR